VTVVPGPREKVVAMQSAAVAGRPRRARVALFVLVAVVGAPVLTGCRSEPAVAAYVDGTRYTERTIDRIVKQTELPDGSPLTVNRQWVLRLLVMRDVAQRLVAERGLTVQRLDPEIISSTAGMAAPNEYVRLWANTYELESALAPTVKPQALSDDDLARFYPAVVAAGLLPAGLGRQEVRAELNGPQVAGLLGLRTVLADAAHNHVTVNPRYAPLAMPWLIGGQGSTRLYQMAVPFPADPTSGVRDIG
jgi:hypothetical protein